MEALWSLADAAHTHDGRKSSPVVPVGFTPITPIKASEAMPPPPVPSRPASAINGDGPPPDVLLLRGMPPKQAVGSRVQVRRHAAVGTARHATPVR